MTDGSSAPIPPSSVLLICVNLCVSVAHSFLFRLRFVCFVSSSSPLHRHTHPMGFFPGDDVKEGRKAGNATKKERRRHLLSSCLPAFLHSLFIPGWLATTNMVPREYRFRARAHEEKMTGIL